MFRDLNNSAELFCLISALFIGLFFVFGGISSLKHEYISIDNKYVYIYRSYFFYKHEYIIPRKKCIPKLTTNPTKTIEEYQVQLTYQLGEVKKNSEFYLGKDKLYALDKMRWLSMYVLYAYNEDLLPDPTPKLGHEDLTIEAEAQSDTRLEQPQQNNSV